MNKNYSNNFYDSSAADDYERNFAADFDSGFNDFSASENSNFGFADNVSLGNQIKKSVQDSLSKKSENFGIKHLFDNIDDSTIEKNVPIALGAIEKNIKKGFISEESLDSMPNLLDGLTMFYAAFEKGNTKAAQKAREVAYTKESASSFNNASSDNYLGSNPYTDNIAQNPSGTRYVSDDGVRIRDNFGLNSGTLGYLNKGEAVNYTGRKTKSDVDGHLWAEVEHNGNTGWIAADYLNMTNPNTRQQYYENSSKYDLSDYTSLQSSFKQDHPGSSQCPSLTNWFLNNFTTLTPPGGDGYIQTKKVAEERDDLQVTNIPCAPAIYSVDKGKPGPGIRNTSDPAHGHTGIILSSKPLENGKYEITIFHTYAALGDKEFNSSIQKKIVTPNDAVTYVNIGNYMK